jgi:hypothetical protein
MALGLAHAVLVPESEGGVLIQQLLPREYKLKFQFLRQMALGLAHAVLVPESEGGVLIQQLLPKEYD